MTERGEWVMSGALFRWLAPWWRRFGCPFGSHLTVLWAGYEQCAICGADNATGGRL